MPKGSIEPTAHTIGNKIYVVMGQETLYPWRVQNELYAYDPITDQWSARAARPTYRAGFASAVVNGLLYVIGGTGQVGDGPHIGDGPTFVAELKSHVEIYDPATDRWSTGAPLPTAIRAWASLRGLRSNLCFWWPEYRRRL